MIRIAYDFMFKEKPCNFLSSLEYDFTKMRNLLKLHQANFDPEEHKIFLQVLDEFLENSRIKVKRSQRVIEKFEQKRDIVESRNKHRNLSNKVT